MEATQIVNGNGNGRNTQIVNGNGNGSNNTRVVSMKGGIGGESYASNSTNQMKAIMKTKPIIEEVIKNVYSRLLPKTLCISDLGCSSGPNTFYAVSLIMKTVDDARLNLGHESPEFMIYLNDLPNNDFNSIFQTVPKFVDDLTDEMGSGFGPCFMTGVPGSFIGRLFPSESIHFVHSSYSLHWLSHAPEGIEDNKGNIYISPTSPPTVAKAYLNQFTKDFATFLRCRAAELVDGGCIVFTIVGRRPGDLLWGPLSKAINILVKEGLVEGEKLDTFNLPVYHPLVSELKGVIDNEGSFTITWQDTLNLDWKVGLDAVTCLRAACEPMLAGHFGDEIMDELFDRYARVLNSDDMSEENTINHNIIMALKKKDGLSLVNNGVN